MTLRISIGPLACCLGLALIAPNLKADIIAAYVSAPFGVQPFSGLPVSGGVTAPFFSDLSGLPFPGPGIVDIVANIQAFDSGGNALSSFAITGVTVMQGASTLTPMLQAFDLMSPITYTDFANPLNQATVDPAALNWAFAFNSDPSFQYSYTLTTSGIPDGGFVIFDDVEGAAPEPSTWFLLATCLAALILKRWRPASKLAIQRAVADRPDAAARKSNR